jgi:hypothetical protein
VDVEGEVWCEGGVDNHLLPAAGMPWGVVDVKRRLSWCAKRPEVGKRRDEAASVRVIFVLNEVCLVP